MILKLEGREKVNAHIIADKLNQLIDEIEILQKQMVEINNKIEEMKTNVS